MNRLAVFIVAALPALFLGVPASGQITLTVTGGLNTAAQAGSTEPHRSLREWMEKARESVLHTSVRAVRPGVPAVADVVQAGVQAAHPTWTVMPVTSDGAVSAGEVFRYTLVGAMAPLSPAMIAMLFSDDGKSSPSLQLWEGLFLLGMHATLVTVPLAARWAGADSLWRTMIGTGVGYIVGGYASLFLARGPEILAVPVYALAMAGVTSLIVSTK